MCFGGEGVEDDDVVSNADLFCTGQVSRTELSRVMQGRFMQSSFHRGKKRGGTFYSSAGDFLFGTSLM